MPIICEAIVEKGLLRPLRNLELADSERVRLTIEPVREGHPAIRETEALLLRSGLFRLPLAEASALAGRDVATASLDEVNRSLPVPIKGKPLSATVIEERNESW